MGVFVGWVLKILCDQIWRFLKRMFRLARLLHLFQSKARLLAPKVYVDVTATSKNGDQETQFQNFKTLAAYFSTQINSGCKVFLVSGSYGIGKSFSCSIVAGLLAQKWYVPWNSITPCILDSTHFMDKSAAVNLIASLNKTIGWTFPDPQPISNDDLSRLLLTPRFLLFLDAADQLPFAQGVQSAMNPLLDLVEDHSARPTNCAAIVVVVRREFLLHNTRLQNLQRRNKVCVINFDHGFTLEQIKDYAGKFLPPSEKDQRVQKITEMLNSANETVRMNLQRPVLVASLMKTPLPEFLKISCSGASMANIYSIRYSTFPPSVKRTLTSLGYYLYERGIYGIPLQPAFYTLSGLTLQDLAEATRDTEALILTKETVQFSHATLRDYFASAAIVATLEDSSTDRLLHHPTTFLVSEMIACLLDAKTLGNLLMAGLSSDDMEVKINVNDVLCELENPDLFERAQAYATTELKKVQNEKMSPYKISLLGSASVLGDEKAINELLSYIEKVGYSVFSEQFYATRGRFQYYNRKEDVAVAEWVNCIRQPKYRCCRRLAAFLIKELELETLPEVLKQVAQDENEPDLELRRIAQQSYDAIALRLSAKASANIKTAGDKAKTEPAASASSE